MKRWLLVLLLVWLVYLLVPGVRERVAPPAAELWARAGASVEGPLSPITDRYRRVRAESNLKKAARLLVTESTMGQRAPPPHELPAFLKRHDIVPDGLDPWGMPYRMVEEPDSLALVSAGPDRTYGTGADVVVRLPYQGRRSSPARR